MIKKSLVIVLTLLAASTMIYKTSSYTRAEVRNDVSLSVVESEKALVSIPSVIQIDRNKANHEIVITNNMTEELTKVDITFEQSKTNELVCGNLKLTADNQTIYEGRSAKKIIKLEQIDKQASQPIETKIKIRTEWKGGSAEITSTLKTN